MFKENNMYSSGLMRDIITSNLLDSISTSKRILERIEYDDKHSSEFSNITNFSDIMLLGQATALSILNISNSYERIVEIGCGPAKISIYIAKILSQNKISGSKIIAIDKSWEMLMQAEENIKKHGLDNCIELVEASVYHLPFSDNSIDCVVMQDVLHEISDPIMALKEINRVVRKDGSYLIRELRRPPNKLVLNAILNLYSRKHNSLQKNMFRSSLESSFTGAELFSLAKEAGMNDYHIRPASFTHIDIIKYGNRFNSKRISYKIESGNVLKDKLLTRSYTIYKK